jgi:ribosome-binding protein aMBF1 (putative translation factor)
MDANRNEPSGEFMWKTIRQLREERGESEMQLTDALSARPKDIQDLEQGISSPAVGRLRLLTEHVGVRDNGIGLEPDHEPSFGERLGDALTP